MALPGRKGAPDKTDGSLDRTGGAVDMTGCAPGMACSALQRTGSHWAGLAVH